MNKIRADCKSVTTEEIADRGTCVVCGRIGGGIKDDKIYCSPMCEEMN